MLDIQVVRNGKVIQDEPQPGDATKPFGLFYHPDGKWRNYPPLTSIDATKWRSKVQLSGGGKTKRRRPTQAQKIAALTSQNNCCGYCDRTFGKYYPYHRTTRKLVAHWDHFVPYSYTEDTTPPIWVASCQRCNNLKGSRVFKSIEHARITLQREIE